MTCHEIGIPYYQFKPKNTSNFRVENWELTCDTQRSCST